MAFSTPIFVYGFLPVMLAAYYLLPRPARNGWLVVGSYLFYGLGNPSCVLVLLFCTTCTFSLALFMPRKGTRTRHLLLLFSILANLGPLVFFRYSGFLAQATRELTEIPGAETLSWLGTVAIPLGISFYTLQALSYSIDVYRGETTPTTRLVDFAAFMAFFPQLIAGPIVRYRQLAPDLKNRRESRHQFANGMGVFIIGLAKKLLLADPCGAVADQAFGAAGPDMLSAWIGLLAYSFQIYFDFSGYSEMAIGLGMMFGFNLPVNFRSPYRATSLRDFWRRWHITLGSWARDYLYIPLGGSRVGRWRTASTLILVMILFGLWHGVAWQFLLWGLLHGLLLAGERVAPGRGLPVILRTALTFLLVSLAWVMFRAQSPAEALHYYASLAGATSPGEASWWTRELIVTWEHLALLLLAALVTWKEQPLADNPTRAKWVVLTALFWICLVFMGSGEATPFLYYYF